MQKLVKRKMHYETIMPVEAYGAEEKDIIDDILIAAGCGVAIATGSMVGMTLCGAALLNEHVIHTEEYREALHTQAEADLLMADALLDGLSAVGEGILEVGAVVGTIQETAVSVAEFVGNAAVEGMVDAVTDMIDNTFGDDDGG